MANGNLLPTRAKAIDNSSVVFFGSKKLERGSHNKDPQLAGKLVDNTGTKRRNPRNDSKRCPGKLLEEEMKRCKAIVKRSLYRESGRCEKTHGLSRVEVSGAVSILCRHHASMVEGGKKVEVVN